MSKAGGVQIIQK